MVGVVAIMLGSKRKPALITFSGIFTAFSASPATTSSRTVTVPSGSSGELRFDNVVADATFQYSKNGAAYVTISGGASVTCANGDTLQFKATGGSGTGGACDLYDVSNGANASSVSCTIS